MKIPSSFNSEYIQYSLKAYIRSMPTLARNSLDLLNYIWQFIIIMFFISRFNCSAKVNTKSKIRKHKKNFNKRLAQKGQEKFEGEI